MEEERGHRCAFKRRGLHLGFWSLTLTVSGRCWFLRAPALSFSLCPPFSASFLLPVVSASLTVGADGQN